MKQMAILLIFFSIMGCSITHPTDPYGPENTKSPGVFPQTKRTSSVQQPTKSISLEQAIEIGLANNPGISAQDFEAEAAAAQQDRIFGERMPEMRLAGDYNHHFNEQRVLSVNESGEPSVLSQDIVSSDLVLSLPLFTGGRLVNQVKAAGLLHQSAKHQLARSRKELVFNVSSVFFNILAQRHVIKS